APDLAGILLVVVGTLRGFRTSRDGAGRAGLVRPRRDRSSSIQHDEGDCQMHESHPQEDSERIGGGLCPPETRRAEQEPGRALVGGGPAGGAKPLPRAAEPRQPSHRLNPARTVMLLVMRPRPRTSWGSTKSRTSRRNATYFQR